MSALLDQSARQAAAQHRLALAEAERVDPARLARWIKGAIHAHPYARTRTESEQDALAQMLAERVTRGQDRAARTARAPRVGPAPVDRKMRSERRFRAKYPETAAARERDQRTGVLVNRKRTTQHALRLTLDTLTRDSREWRDTADGYARKRAAQQDSGPRVRVSATAPDVLSQASDRERESDGRDPVVMPADLLALADSFCARESGTDGQRRNIRCALLVYALPSSADVANALAGEGEKPSSANAIDQAAFKGRKLLRERYPDPDDDTRPGTVLRERLGALADELGAWDGQAMLESGALWKRPRLTRVQHAARELLDEIAPTDGAPRAVVQMPDDALWRTRDGQDRPARIRAPRVGFAPAPVRAPRDTRPLAFRRTRPLMNGLVLAGDGYPFPLAVTGDDRTYPGMADGTFDPRCPRVGSAGAYRATVRVNRIGSGPLSVRPDSAAQRAARKRLARQLGEARAYRHHWRNRLALIRAHYSPDADGPLPAAPIGRVPEAPIAPLCQCERCSAQRESDDAGKADD